MIELRIRNVSQLFNTLDPFPFRERDLAPDAQDYLVMRAQEGPSREPIAISINVDSGLDVTSSSDVVNAVHVWFASKADDESKHMRRHFKDARLALVIGVCVLSICLFAALRISQSYPETPGIRILQESFVIIGWVVLWRPIEMLLYDWVPMSRRRTLYRRLATAFVSVKHTGQASSTPQA